jgi:hypothetical protein
LQQRKDLKKEIRNWLAAFKAANSRDATTAEQEDLRDVYTKRKELENDYIDLTKQLEEALTRDKIIAEENDYYKNNGGEGEDHENYGPNVSIDVLRLRRKNYMNERFEQLSKLEGLESFSGKERSRKAGSGIYY